jgi:lipopolysaccharide transport system ATP-binding protein
MRFVRCAGGTTLDPEMYDENVAISIKHLTKKFRMPLQRLSSDKWVMPSQRFFSRIESRLKGKKTMYDEFNAVDDLSFTIRHGETVGVIGPNGSGKSTLLKLLAGVLYPTQGCILVQGRVAPFLELGVGFEPELTARENIYLYGAIMGMSRREIDRKYWDILKFAELRRFEDMKIRNFSSGMHLRLGFSIAIQTNPDILLVDEVLAVGDEAFQQKCMGKIEEFRKDGKTILFVSHDLDQIRAVCRSCLLFREGRIVSTGTPHEVIQQYLREVEEAGGKSAPSSRIG